MAQNWDQKRAGCSAVNLGSLMALSLLMALNLACICKMGEKKS